MQIFKYVKKRQKLFTWRRCLLWQKLDNYWNAIATLSSKSLPHRRKKRHSYKIMDSTCFKRKFHCLKSVHIRIYFWSVFSCIGTEYGKIRTRNNSVYVHFSHISWIIRAYQFHFKERIREIKSKGRLIQWMLKLQKQISLTKTLIII